MNPNATAFKPGAKLTMAAHLAQLALVKQAADLAPEVKDESKPSSELDTLDPKRYDDMFPSLGTPSKQANPSAGRPPPPKKWTARKKPGPKESQHSKDALPPSVESNRQSFDARDEPKQSTAPSSTAPLPKVDQAKDEQVKAKQVENEQFKIEPTGVETPKIHSAQVEPASARPAASQEAATPLKPVTPLKPILVGSHQGGETGTQKSLEAGPSTAVSDQGPSAVPKANRRNKPRHSKRKPETNPTSKPSHELPGQLTAENISAMDHSQKAALAQPYGPHLPWPGDNQYGHGPPTSQPCPVQTDEAVLRYSVDQEFFPAGPEAQTSRVQTPMHPVEQASWNHGYHHQSHQRGTSWAPYQPSGDVVPMNTQAWMPTDYQQPHQPADFNVGPPYASGPPMQLQMLNSTPFDNTQSAYSCPWPDPGHGNGQMQMGPGETVQFGQQAGYAGPGQGMGTNGQFINLPEQHAPSHFHSRESSQCHSRNGSRHQVEHTGSHATANQHYTGQLSTAANSRYLGRPTHNRQDSSGHVLSATPPVSSNLNHVNLLPQETPKGPRTSNVQWFQSGRSGFGQSQSSTSFRPENTASWSHSKRWVSGETKERTAFQRMMANLQYMGANKSPFIPQTAAELSAFKAEMAESEKGRLLQKMADMQAMIKFDGSDQGGQLSLFKGKEPQDNLSPVFAILNCFCQQSANKDDRVAEWPSLAELKEEGDRRNQLTRTRSFPLPRICPVATAMSFGHLKSPANPDSMVPWFKKEVRVGSRDIIPVHAPDDEDLDESSVEDELPDSVKIILEYIDSIHEDNAEASEDGKKESK